MSFLPYGRQSIDQDDIDAVVAVLRSDYLTTGPEVPRFEAALCGACDAPFAVAVCNGTAALHATSAALGLGPGDEVLVPAITFAATANGARYVGAEPRFVDVDPDTGLMRPEAIEAAVTPRTRAIYPVHMTGLPADLDAIGAVAAAHGLRVVEDAAHALGARLGDEPIGACRRSDMAIFSFHPVKHVTTGEGGAILTRDPDLTARLRRFRDHGMARDEADFREPSPGPWYHEQQDLGMNYRLSALQCALGTSQLAKLEAFVARRRAIAARYDAAFAAHARVRPLAPGPAGAVSAYHLYVVLIDFDALGTTRAAVMNGLRERGVGTQVHYIPVPAHPYYRDRGHDPAAYPGAQRYYARALSLPMYPALTDADVDRVVSALDEVLGAC
jgi:perosamine synthetase